MNPHHAVPAGLDPPVTARGLEEGAAAAGRPGSASMTSGASRGRRASSAGTLAKRRARRRPAPGRGCAALEQGAGALTRTPLARCRAPRRSRSCVARGQCERLAGRVGGQHQSARPGARDRGPGQPATQLDHAPAAQLARLQLARERQAAAPQHGPVGRERRPLHRARIGQLRDLGGLQHAQLAAGQRDRLGHELAVQRLPDADDHRDDDQLREPVAAVERGLLSRASLPHHRSCPEHQREPDPEARPSAGRRPVVDLALGASPATTAASMRQRRTSRPSFHGAGCGAAAPWSLRAARSRSSRSRRRRPSQPARRRVDLRHGAHRPRAAPSARRGARATSPSSPPPSRRRAGARARARPGSWRRQRPRSRRHARGAVLPVVAARFGAVAVRTAQLGAGSQRSRSASSSNAANSRSTGTATVLVAVTAKPSGRRRRAQATRALVADRDRLRVPAGDAVLLAQPARDLAVGPVRAPPVERANQGCQPGRSPRRPGPRTPAARTGRALARAGRHWRSACGGRQCSSRPSSPCARARGA